VPAPYTRTVNSEVGERPHVGHCLWSWAWAVVGAVFAACLDVVIVLPVAALLAWPLGRRFWAGAFTGACVPFLWVAHVQSQPGGLSPWPWLVIGVSLIAGGFMADRHENSANRT
jgi:hypothetical protein